MIIMDTIDWQSFMIMTTTNGWMNKSTKITSIFLEWDVFMISCIHDCLRFIEHKIKQME